MSWVTAEDLDEQERIHFGGQTETLALSGAPINDSKTNFTQLVRVGDRRYYVKRYLIPGKHFRRFLGFSRVTREWRNLNWFRKNSIPCCRVVAMGQGNRWFGRYWGVIVTEEVPETIDLNKLFLETPNQLRDSNWKLAAIKSLSSVVAAMHHQGFIHNDLQWRNILVTLDDDPKGYLIDCPAGRLIYLLGNRRGIVRDLALMDKMAKVALSRTDRLRFYKQYLGVARLRERDKKEVARILSFLS